MGTLTERSSEISELAIYNIGSRIKLKKTLSTNLDGLKPWQHLLRR